MAKSLKAQLAIIKRLAGQIGQKIRRVEAIDDFRQAGNQYRVAGNSVTGLVINAYYPPDLALLAGLTELTHLSLCGSGLTSISPLANLTRLKTVEFTFNEIRDVAPLAGLNQLTTLDLSYNKISDVAPLAGLNQLTTLDLSYNGISDVAPLAGLNHLTTLHLGANPLPESVWSLSEKELLQYVRSLDQSEVLYEAKLILVGAGAVGKTSLLAAMTGQPFVEERQTTHGIEICSFELAHPEQTDVNLRLNAWDFGGQEVYQITHQFFYSKQSLFLLLWSPRMGMQQCDVEGWIQRIKLRVGAEARIIIVATHCRSCERVPRIDKEGLRRRYGEMIVAFHEIDSGVNIDPDHPVAAEPAGAKIGVADLQESVAKAAAGLPQMGFRLNPKWKTARDTVLDLKQGASAEGGCACTHIGYEKFSEICTEQGLSAENTRLLAELLHVLGYILYYGDDEDLRDEVVLQPEWLTKAIGLLLEDRQTSDGYGELEHERLVHIWRDHTKEDQPRYDPKLYPFLMGLMRKYDVIYQLDPNTSLVAQLVPEALQEDRPWHHGDPGPEGEGSISLVCQMDEDPPGLVPWMIVRTHQFATEPRRHWQHGMYLSYEGYGSALLEQRDREFIATVRAQWPNYFMGMLRYTLERLINERWPGLETTFSVPCPTSGCKGRFPLDTLYKLQQKGSVIPCLTCGEFHEIPMLLTGFATQRFVDPDAFKQTLEDIMVMVTDSNERLRSNQRLLKEISSKAAAWLMLLLRAIGTETKECPRLYTLLSDDLSRLNPTHIGKQGYRLTLWCEMPGHEHPVCPIGSGKKDHQQGQRGEYLFEAPREWLVKVAPYASLIARTLKVIIPVAGAVAKASLDETLLKDSQIGPKLDLMEKLTQTCLQGNLDTGTRGIQEGDRVMNHAEGEGLRAFCSLLHKLDESGTWGELRRTPIPTKTGEFLWLCPKHYAEYQPAPPQFD